MKTPNQPPDDAPYCLRVGPFLLTSRDPQQRYWRYDIIPHLLSIQIGFEEQGVFALWGHHAPTNRVFQDVDSACEWLEKLLTKTSINLYSLLMFTNQTTAQIPAYNPSQDSRWHKWITLNTPAAPTPESQTPSSVEGDSS